MDDWQFKPGDEIGPYRIERPIAVGGMGEVYQASHSFLPRTVALKVLQLLRAEKSDFKDRMRAEAGILCELDHPNVVRLYDAGMTDKTVWMAMELLVGKPLNELLFALGALSIPNALHIVAEVADGVHAAHEVGVIHRDLKPANIFVTEQKGVKVLDFGTSKFKDRGVKTTDRMRLLGTYAYMSPEHLLNSPTPDKRTDVFALGLIAYEMMLGRHPYSDEDGRIADSRSIGERIILFEPKPLTELVDGFPDYVWQIVKKALARNRDERFSTMVELAREARAARKRYIAERGMPEGFMLPSESGARKQYESYVSPPIPQLEPKVPSQRVVAPGAQPVARAPAVGRGTIRMAEASSAPMSAPVPPAAAAWNPMPQRTTPTPMQAAAPNAAPPQMPRPPAPAVPGLPPLMVAPYGIAAHGVPLVPNYVPPTQLAPTAHLTPEMIPPHLRALGVGQGGGPSSTPGAGPESGPTPVLPNRAPLASDVSGATAAIPLVQPAAKVARPPAESFKPLRHPALVTTEPRILSPDEGHAARLGRGGVDGRASSQPSPPTADARRVEGTPAPMAFRGEELTLEPPARPLRHAVLIGVAIGTVAAVIGVWISRRSASAPTTATPAESATISASASPAASASAQPMATPETPAVTSAPMPPTASATATAAQSDAPSPAGTTAPAPKAAAGPPKAPSRPATTPPVAPPQAGETPADPWPVAAPPSESKPPTGAPKQPSPSQLLPKSGL